MRVQIIVPPAIGTGISVSIRKYVSRVLDVGEVGFLDGQSVDVDVERRDRLEELRGLAHAGDLKALLRRAVDERLNMRSRVARRRARRRSPARSWR